jgi:hypothetical protein
MERISLSWQEASPSAVMVSKSWALGELVGFERSAL